jgi:hypothetical protein
MKEMVELKASSPSSKIDQSRPHVELPPPFSAVLSDSPPHHPLTTLTAAAIRIRLYTFVFFSVSTVGQPMMEAHPCAAPDGRVSLNDCSPAAVILLSTGPDTASQPHGDIQEGNRYS